jgi:hypothetical protein
LYYRHYCCSREEYHDEQYVCEIQRSPASYGRRGRIEDTVLLFKDTVLSATTPATRARRSDDSASVEKQREPIPSDDANTNPGSFDVCDSGLLTTHNHEASGTECKGS